MPDKLTDTDDLDAKPVRRTFTPEFKARILAEYDAAPDATARGAILRRGTTVRITHPGLA